MNTEKTLKTILILSVLPLLLALLLALYFKFNLAELTGVTIKFARLNAYIFAHSYGALLLASFCGINIGQALQQSWNGLSLWLNFGMLLLSWLSYKSFANWQGMAFLIFCWSAFLLISRYFNHSGQSDVVTSNQIMLKIQLTVILLLSLITLING